MTILSSPNPELLESFLLDAWDALGSFEGALQNLEDISSLKNLSVVTHRLRGSAALYGFEQIAKLAEITERVLAKSGRFAPHQFEDIRTLLQQVAVVFSSSLEQIAATGQEAKLGSEFAALGGSALLNKLIKQYPELFLEEQRSSAASSTRLSQVLQIFYREQQENWSFFAPEAEEISETIEQQLDLLKTQGFSKEPIDALFRATHTLKGAASMVGLEVMAAFAHKLEDLMVKVRNQELQLSTEVLDCLAKGNKVLGLMLDTARGRQTQLEAELDNAEAKLSALLGLEPATRQSQEPARSELLLSLEGFFAENQDVWEYFAPEVFEYLETTDVAIDQLRANPADDTALHSLFRAMHSLKGAAYTIGFKPLGHLAADVEQLSQFLQTGQIEPDDKLLDDLAKARAVMAKLMDNAKGEANDSELALAKLLQNLSYHLPELHSKSLLSPESNPKEPGESKKSSIVRVSSEKLDSLMDLAAEIINLHHQMNQQLEQLTELNQMMQISQNRMLRTVSDFEAQYLNPQLSSQNSGSKAISTESQRGISSSLQDIFAELEFDSYNDLNILARSVSEMAHDVSEIKEELASYYQAAQADKQQLHSISKRLRHSISRARMVPISQLFGLLKRLLKNTAHKSYRLETSGENVELDTTILEAVSDSLMHLVRNALVHGIEGQEERRAKGKNPEGLIQIRAFPKGNHVFIEVQDDGAGINIEEVKAKALELGFKSPTELAMMSEQEACQLIFMAGLSTAKELSSEAGRGVGMDAVLSAVKKLKGEIHLQTTPGQGSLFSLKLPLTLLIADALMFDLAGQTFAFAADSIESLQSLNAQDISLLEGKTYIRYQDKLLELRDLRHLLGFPERTEESYSVIIVNAENQHLAFRVDAHLGLSEIIVRDLHPSLAKLHYLSNATLSATGDIILLLDPLGLRHIEQGKLKKQEAKAQESQKVLEVLVVDDSLSVRRVLGKMLERNSYKVTTAADGQEAFERILQQPFDVVLSDLEMPRLNGYELLEALRHRPESRHLPIIIMTTRAGDKHRNLALELGATAYFSKPVDEAKLLLALKQLGQSS